MYNEIKLNILSKFLFYFLILLSVNIAFSQTNPIKTVVIDAGHGGKDPGCHGNIANEKDVCLKMALKLGEKIKTKYKDVNVVFTRETDVFVELLERANIANKAKADLFICIHANAASESAFGSETYVLGLHRTDAQQKVMERENSIIELENDKGEKYKNFDMSPEAMIALQLQGSIFRGNSIKFAEQVQKEFKNIGRYDRGVKEAGFYVLYKTAMPSVLIETGFLTNQKEEKILANESGQEQMATAMFLAFQNYYNKMTLTDVENNKSDETNQNEILIKDLLQDNQQTNEKQNNIETLNNLTDLGKDSLVNFNEVVFSVQIKSSSNSISLKSEVFNGLQVFEYFQDNLFKYCSGSFVNNYEAASEYKLELREKGFNHAFTVAFLNGERINIEKAVNLAKNRSN